MNEHYQIAKEELKKLVTETFKEVMAEKEAKPDFLDLDKDGDKEEPMKKAAKDKKEKEVEEGKHGAGKEKPKYAKSQDKEHDDAKELGAKLAGKLEESNQEEKQVVTETPQQPKEVKETNKTWYNTSLYNKLMSKWTKKGDK